ncbi:MFS transporter [Pseudonocardia phyllosphaerae]|uniref:MFS transporter n=1 Tax=Pseudonocardia phyllosphaerae TaxID=3390502 RepID=UPI0039794904
MKSSLRAARAVTFAYFVLCGTLMGTWVVHIPAIEQRVGIGHAALGSMLVLLGVGVFVGMQVAGRMIDRFGARLVVPAGGVASGAALVLPGIATDTRDLSIALLIFGFGNGCLDVAMNAHAVHVERAYGRPLMSSFHATFSVGGVLASLLASAAITAGVGTATLMVTIGGTGALVASLLSRGLLPAGKPEDVTPEATTDSPSGSRAPRRIWLLAGLAMMTMLSEGAANDWSALHLKDTFGASTTVAAFAFGTFASMMTLGRMMADRISDRFGPVAVLRYGAASAAVGITTAALAPSVPLAIAGWGLFGLGLSGCIPQLFSAAGNIDSTAGVNVSRVAGIGYVGMLAGPAVIGWLTHVVPLNHALVLLSFLCVVSASAAGIVRTRSGPLQQQDTPHPPTGTRHPGAGGSGPM